MSHRPNLVGLSGSLRQGSFSTAILRTAAEQVADQADLTVIVPDVPLYNEDLDNAEPPASVSALRAAAGAAAALVIATPEYNYGISGVLKNALDWLSRPYGQSKLTGKLVLTLSSSPASTGGVRAQSQLHDVLLANAAILLPRPQTVIGLAHEKVQQGRLTDAASLQFLSDGMTQLLAAVADRRLQHA